MQYRKGPRVQVYFKNPSLVKKEFHAETEISNILKKFRKVHGVEYFEVVGPGQSFGGSYFDSSDVVDYRTAFEQVERANARFDALPAILRQRFDNDPAKFLDYASDSKNLDEMIKLGIAKKRETAHQDAAASIQSTEASK